MHQFQVFMLGYCIINKNKQIQDLLAEYLRRKGLSDKAPNLLMDDVITCWFLASVFHDLASSIERINRWLGSFFGTVFPPPPAHQISEKPEELLRKMQLTIPWGNIFSIYDGIFDYYKTKLSKLIFEQALLETREVSDDIINRKLIGLLNESMIESQDHGLYAGLILLHITEDESNQIVNEASLAIALHSPRVYKKLHMRLRELDGIEKLDPKDFPFAFLLVFCDNAQQWGRPQMKKMVEDIEIKITDLKIDEYGNVVVQLDYSRPVTDTVLQKIREPWDFWENCFSDRDVCMTIRHQF